MHGLRPRARDRQVDRRHAPRDDRGREPRRRRVAVRRATLPRDPRDVVDVEPPEPDAGTAALASTRRAKVDDSSPTAGPGDESGRGTLDRGPRRAPPPNRPPSQREDPRPMNDEPDAGRPPGRRQHRPARRHPARRRPALRPDARSATRRPLGLGRRRRRRAEPAGSRDRWYAAGARREPPAAAGAPGVGQPPATAAAPAYSAPVQPATAGDVEAPHRRRASAPSSRPRSCPRSSRPAAPCSSSTGTGALRPRRAQSSDRSGAASRPAPSSRSPSTSRRPSSTRPPRSARPSSRSRHDRRQRPTRSATEPRGGIGSGVIYDAERLDPHQPPRGRGRANKLTVELKDGRQFEGRVYGIDTLTDLAIVKVDETGPPGRPDRRTRTGSRSASSSSRSAARSARTRSRSRAGSCPARAATSRSTAASGSRTSSRPTRRSTPATRAGRWSTPRGAVVGINTAVATDSSGIGFAIPIDIARPIMDQARRRRGAHAAVDRDPLRVDRPAGQEGRRPHASTTARCVSTADGERLRRSSPDSPAAKAGLKDGDVILSINGIQIDQEHPLDALLVQFKPDDTVDARRPPRRHAARRRPSPSGRDPATSSDAAGRRALAGPAGAAEISTPTARNVPPRSTAGLRIADGDLVGWEVGEDLVRDAPRRAPRSGRNRRRLDDLAAGRRTPRCSRPSARGRRDGPAGWRFEDELDVDLERLRRPLLVLVDAVRALEHHAVDRIRSGRVTRRGAAVAPARRPPAADDRVGDPRGPDVLADVVDADDVDARPRSPSAVVASVASTRWSAGRSSTLPERRLARRARAAPGGRARRARRGPPSSARLWSGVLPNPKPGSTTSAVPRRRRRRAPGRSPRWRSATTSATTFR